MSMVMAAAAIAAALGLGAGFVVAGQLGLAVTGTVFAGLAITVARAAFGKGAARRAAVRRRRAGSDDGVAAFHAYRKIASGLGWAGVSRRQYDLSVRPLFARLAAAALADRHRIDMVRDPEGARRVLGPGLWPLVGPARRATRDDRDPGVDRATLERIVNRLEEL